MKIGVYKDNVSKDGCIYSGPKVFEFKIERLADLPAELEKRFPEKPWRACADGSDGRYENSDGFGHCLVSNIESD